jgi:hypothetical protein
MSSISLATDCPIIAGNKTDEQNLRRITHITTLFGRTDDAKLQQ